MNNETTHCPCEDGIPHATLSRRASRPTELCEGQEPGKRPSHARISLIDLDERERQAKAGPEVIGRY